VCHELDFRPNFNTLPLTLELVDLLLTKLQTVEVNEKDVREILQLSAFPVAGDSRGRAAR
jgi:hypothetical protein